MDMLFECIEIGKMNDQRVKAGSTLGLENPRNGTVIAGIRAQSVHRLCRERDQPT
jgi:hypothetical protein